MYNLYIKTHNQTGLKYLGYTKQDPFKYRGSGVEWTKHLNENGYDIDTEILGIYETKKELEVCGLFYSKMFNIVESSEWANKIPETTSGAGSLKGRSGSFKGKKHTKETKRKMSLARSRQQITQLQLNNLLKQAKSSPSIETREKMRQAKLGTKQSSEHIKKRLETLAITVAKRKQNAG